MEKARINNAGLVFFVVFPGDVRLRNGPARSRHPQLTHTKVLGGEGEVWGGMGGTFLQKGPPFPLQSYSPSFFFSQSLFNWPQAALMSCPLLLRRMAVTPLDQRIFSKARMSASVGAL